MAGRYPWPDDTRLAVYLALNLGHFAFGEGLGAELCPSEQPDVLNFSWRDYGNRVGVWRLLDLFDDPAIPASVLVNSSIYGYCPEVMAAVRRRGDEIVAHGRTNSERQGSLAGDAEAQLIRETTEICGFRGAEAERLARAVDFTEPCHTRFVIGDRLRVLARLVHG